MPRLPEVTAPADKAVGRALAGENQEWMGVVVACNARILTFIGFHLSFGAVD